MTQVSQCLWLVDCPGLCSRLIVQVGVVLRRTIVGCDLGESMFVVG